MILPNHTLRSMPNVTHTRKRQCSCKSQGNTRTNGRENSQSSRGQQWHNPKDKSTWLLCCSEFNSWSLFPPGVQGLCILGTSLLIGLGAFQRGPVENSCVWSSLHLNRHNSLLRDPMDALVVAYESRLQLLFIHI
jgi:hypothetical protein